MFQVPIDGVIGEIRFRRFRQDFSEVFDFIVRQTNAAMRSVSADLCQGFATVD